MLSQIRVFLVALEEGSLNRAAARLHMSQSALTRQMQALEAEVGGALLERTTIGVRPTDAGHALASSMKRVIADYDSALAEARRLARGQRDLVRVGYLGSVAQPFLDPALAVFRRSHPSVKVKLLDLSPGEQIAALRSGEIDIGITGHEGVVAASEFYTRKLATFPMLAILSAHHRLARRRLIGLKDLREELFLAAPEKDLPGRDRWLTQLCRRAGFRPRFDQVADSLSHMLTMVSSDDVVAIAPAYLKSVSAAGVAMVPLSDADARWNFLVIWQRGKMSEAVKALLDALAARVDQSCEEAAHRRSSRKRPPRKANVPSPGSAD